MSGERKFDDNEDCYSYASAQVANDIRIDEDIAAARGEFDSEFSRISRLARQVDGFYYRNERNALLRSCMEAKGYRRK